LPRMLLALILASAAAAAEFDFRAPEFWKKGYPTPLSYCTHSYTLESAGVPETGLKDCRRDPFSFNSARVRLLCPAPGDSGYRLQPRLMRAGRLLDYKLSCQPVPDYPELYYKRSRLTEERAKLALSSASAPGVFGLLEAQLGTLAAIIELHERAKTPLLELYVVPPGDSAEQARKELDSRRYQDQWELTRTKNKHMRDWHPWDRKSYDACQQVPYALLEFAVDAKASGLAALEKSLSALGEPVAGPPCGLGSGLKAGRMLLHPGDFASLQRAAASLPGLRVWNRSIRQRYHGDVTDDERVDVLTKELSEHAAALEAAPHVRALAEAEVARVRETAEGVRALKKGTLVFVRLLPAAP
jgi:hypothetical protein